MLEALDPPAEHEQQRRRHEPLRREVRKDHVDQAAEAVGEGEGFLVGHERKKNTDGG
ncbi:MAG TPA: hypothetical protein VHS58_09505 [Acetobacteraceae bacterium]|nr:hypothetical protein [Acetobacteraceae bacterium]